MKKYTIAEILHIAADKYLASKASESYSWGTGSKDKYSCCAIAEAVYNLVDTGEYEKELTIARISEGLEAMGCPVNSLDAFNDRGQFNPENQQARYAWLKFAAMMAEEQGV